MSTIASSSVKASSDNISPSTHFLLLPRAPFSFNFKALKAMHLLQQRQEGGKERSLRVKNVEGQRRHPTSPLFIKEKTRPIAISRVLTLEKPTHIQTFIGWHSCILAHLHICTLAHSQTCTLALFTRTHLHICTLVHLHTCTFTHLHICILSKLHVCTFAYLHIGIQSNMLLTLLTKFRLWRNRSSVPSVFSSLFLYWL